jgi:hypothetical protein
MAKITYVWERRTLGLLIITTNMTSFKRFESKPVVQIIYICTHCNSWRHRQFITIFYLIPIGTNNLTNKRIFSRNHDNFPCFICFCISSRPYCCGALHRLYHKCNFWKYNENRDLLILNRYGARENSFICQIISPNRYHPHSSQCFGAGMIY